MIEPNREGLSPLGRELIAGLRRFEDFLRGKFDFPPVIRDVERKEDGTLEHRDRSGAEISRKPSAKSDQDQK